MNSNQFSFKNLLEISSISQSNQSSKNQSLNKNQKESEQFYKQKYLETKQNVKKFIEMVEKEFEKLNKAHNDEKLKLKKQIQQLTRELNQRKDTSENDVSNFTARSKRINTHENSFNSNKRSISNETKNNFSVVCLDGIEGFGEQSKIMNQTTKSYAISTKSQTLIQLENALNQERQSSRSRISQKTRINALENLTENDLSTNSLNINEYKNHIFGCRKNKLQQGKLKERQQNAMSLAQQKQNTPTKKSENKQVTISREDFSNRKGKQNTEVKGKQNQNSSKRQDSSNKVQQKQVRNILKNLRNTMKVNIEKQSKLEAPLSTR